MARGDRVVGVTFLVLLASPGGGVCRYRSAVAPLCPGLKQDKPLPPTPTTPEDAPGSGQTGLCPNPQNL